MEVPQFKHWLQIDETEYTDWKDIEKKVIKTAEEELHEKADIWFHYSPVYDQDVSLKVPYKIDFKVIRSAKDGDKQIVDNAKRAITQILQNGRLSPQKCSNIIDAMTIYNYHLIRDKVIDLFMHINANKKDIRDPAEYAYISMMRYIESIENE